MIYFNPNRFVGGTSLGNLYVRLTADPSQLIQGMNDAESSLTSSTEAMVKQAETAGVLITAALAVIGGVSVSEFGKFNQAMTESESIMGDISEQMKQNLEDTAIAISKNSVFSAAELAKSYYYIVSSGQSAAQAIKLIGPISQFATAGMMSLTQATQDLTNAQIALGLKVQDPTKNMENLVLVSDTLTKASIIADGTIQQFSEALANRAAGTMRAYGMSVGEGVAVLADFANQGLKGSAAGMDFVIVLRDLMEAATKSPQVFQQLGIQVYDSSGKLQKMSSILKEMETAFAGASDQEKVQALTMLGFQQRAQSYMLTLLGTSDALADYENQLSQVGGTTEKVAGIQLTSLNNQWKEALHNLQAVAIELGQELSPYVIQLMHDLTDMSTHLLDSQQKFGTLTAVATTFADSVKVMLLGLDGLYVILKTLGDIVAGSLIDDYENWQAAIEGIIQISALWINTIKDVIDGLVEMAAAALQSATIMDDVIHGRFTAAKDEAVSIADAAGEAMKGIVASVNTSVTQSAEIVSTTAKKIGSNIADNTKVTVDDIKKQWGGLVDYYTTLNIQALNPNARSVSPAEKRSALGPEAPAGTSAISYPSMKGSLPSPFDYANSDPFVQAALNIKQYTDAINNTSDALQRMLQTTQIVAAGSAFLTGKIITGERGGRGNGGGQITTPEDTVAGQLQNYRQQTASIVASSSGGSTYGKVTSYQNQEATQKSNLAAYQKAANEEVNITKEAKQQEEDIVKAANQRMSALELAQTQLIVGAYGTMFGQMADLVAQYGSKQSTAYKVLFDASKTFAIADASLKMAQATAQIMADPTAPTLAQKLAYVAVMGTETVAIIADIMAITYQGKASGGPVTAGETYIVGEKGPELFSPAQNGNIIPNHALGGDGGGGNTTVNVHNYSDSPASVKQSSDGNNKMIEVIIEKTKKSIASEISQGQGRIAQSIQRSFGLQRGQGY